MAGLIVGDAWHIESARLSSLILYLPDLGLLAPQRANAWGRLHEPGLT